MCLVDARTTIRQLLHTDVLQEFHDVRNRGVIQSKSWDKLLDSNLGSDSSRTIIKSVLEERVGVPFETGDVSLPF